MSNAISYFAKTALWRCKHIQHKRCKHSGFITWLTNTSDLVSSRSFIRKAMTLLTSHWSVADASAAPSSSLLSRPQTLSTIQKVLEGQLPSNESGTTDGLPDGVEPISSGEGEQEGQLVEVKFRAMKAGKYNLQLMCMSGEQAFVMCWFLLASVMYCLG